MRGIFSHDVRPRFPIPESWLSTYDNKLINRFSTPQSELLLSLVRQHIPEATEWVNIYSDIVHFSQLTHIESVQSKGKSWLDSLDVGGWTNVLILRLLNWRPLQESSDNNQNIAELLRLGSMLYLAPIWRKYGVSPVRTKILVQELVALRSKSLIKWNRLWILEAWILVVGAMESDLPERRYFVEELGTLARSNSLVAMELLEQVKNVLWIHDVFYIAESNLQAELDLNHAVHRVTSS
jgi:hypothetical protein